MEAVAAVKEAAVGGLEARRRLRTPEAAEAGSGIVDEVFGESLEDLLQSPAVEAPHPRLPVDDGAVEGADVSLEEEGMEEQHPPHHQQTRRRVLPCRWRRSRFDGLEQRL